LKLMPTVPKTFFSWPWHSGQTVSESSLKSWWTSNLWPQLLHAYE